MPAEEARRRQELTPRQRQQLRRLDRARREAYWELRDQGDSHETALALARDLERLDRDVIGESRRRELEPDDDPRGPDAGQRGRSRPGDPVRGTPLPEQRDFMEWYTSEEGHEQRRAMGQDMRAQRAAGEATEGDGRSAADIEQELIAQGTDPALAAELAEQMAPGEEMREPGPGYFGGGDQGVLIEGEPLQPGSHPALGPGRALHRMPEQVYEQLPTQARNSLPIAVTAAERHDVPVGLLAGLIQHESGWNEQATRRRPDGTSYYGIAGIGSEELERMGRDRSWAMDPENAVDFAASTIGDAYDRYGSMAAALVEWRDGREAAERFLETGEIANEQTSSFVEGALQAAQQYDPMGQYEFDGPQLGEPARIAEVSLTNPVNIEHAATELGRHVWGRAPDAEEAQRIIDAVHGVERQQQMAAHQAGVSAEEAAMAARTQEPGADPGTVTAEAVGPASTQALVQQQLEQINPLETGATRLNEAGQALLNVLGRGR